MRYSPGAGISCRDDINCSAINRQGDVNVARPDLQEPVIVVGSGIAGGLLALAAAESGPVVLITDCLLYTSPSPRDRS